MDDVRIGNTLRALRIRKHLRQSDVSRRTGVPRQTVSRLERGGFSDVPFRDFRCVANALGIRVDITLRWQGGDLAHVTNEAHAQLHESVATRLARVTGWIWRPEVSFSIYGERGVIDILAWHEESRTLLIIELKTQIIDPQELAASMGRRVRLGRQIAEQQGWSARHVGAWVVVTESSTNRRRYSDHRQLLSRAFPADGRAMRSWIRRPSGTVAALSFWSDVGLESTRRTIRRTQRVRPTQRAPGMVGLSVNVSRRRAVNPGRPTLGPSNVHTADF